MGYFKSLKIAPNTWYIREILGVGAYLFIGENFALLSDTGNGFKDISKPVRKITDKPLIVMNTHGHSDHSGGNSPFGEIHMHPSDMYMLDAAWQKNQREMLWGYAKKKYPFARLLINMVEKKLSKNMTIKTVPLENGHIFELGGRNIKTLHFPGHSPGTVLLLDEATKTLYAGDAINHGLFLFFNGSPSPKEYARRLRSLISLSGYDFIRGSHHTEAMPFSFISYLADFLDRVKNGMVTDLPNDGNIPVLKYSEPIAGYSFKEITVFYTDQNM